MVGRTSRALSALSPLAALAAIPAFAAAFAGCGAEPSDSAPSTGRVTEAIVDGTPSPRSDDSVVSLFALRTPTSGFRCTGTLIAPNLVLTAAHCVTEYDARSACGAFSTPYDPTSISVSLGAMPGAARATGSAIYLDTKASTKICGNDVALLQLDRDIPDAKVSLVRFTTAKVGEVARAVGYGQNGSGGSTDGRYAKDGLTVDAVGPSSLTFQPPSEKSIDVLVRAGEIATGVSTCYGDSGGPLFDAAGNVIGVTSHLTDTFCRDRPAIYSDTLSHEKLFTETARAAGHPLASAAAVPDLPPSARATPAPPRPVDTTSSYRGQTGGGCAFTPSLHRPLHALFALAPHQDDDTEK